MARNHKSLPTLSTLKRDAKMIAQNYKGPREAHVNQLIKNLLTALRFVHESRHNRGRSDGQVIV